MANRITSIEPGEDLAVVDPLAIVERYEQLTELIKERLLAYSQDIRPRQTVRQWLSAMYGDEDLIFWDRERRDLEGFLPLGYFGE